MRRLTNCQSGSAAVIFTVGLTAFFCLLALASDVGIMLVAKNQMQVAVDASALAAASGLKVSDGEALVRAQAVSTRNTIMNNPLNLSSNEISFGTGSTVCISAVRTVNLFFSRMFGINSVQVSASACAELGDRDIMLLFDRSGSMDDDTRYPWIPQPITDTKTAAKYLVDKIEENTAVRDRLGLVSYSTTASLDEELSRNFIRIKRRINSYRADGWTNIAQAIGEATGHLRQEVRGRTCQVEILLSDGKATRPSDPITARNAALVQARKAARYDIKIYTVSLGNDTDWQLMDEIAEITQGEHYHAPTPQELDEIFEEIAAKLPTVLIS